MPIHCWTPTADNVRLGQSLSIFFVAISNINIIIIIIINIAVVNNIVVGVVYVLLIMRRRHWQTHNLPQLGCNCDSTCRSPSPAPSSSSPLTKVLMPANFADCLLTRRRDGDKFGSQLQL
ncbi:hypothetical protein ACLKA7_011450 [Drosophila subpalustris]